MRNGDFLPTRLQAQQDAVNIVCHSKTRSNPENNVGLITLAKYGAGRGWLKWGWRLRAGQWGRCCVCVDCTLCLGNQAPRLGPVCSDPTELCAADLQELWEGGEESSFCSNRGFHREVLKQLQCSVFLLQ